MYYLLNKHTNIYQIYKKSPEFNCYMHEIERIYKDDTLKENYSGPAVIYEMVEEDYISKSEDIAVLLADMTMLTLRT